MHMSRHGRAKMVLRFDPPESRLLYSYLPDCRIVGDVISMRDRASVRYPSAVR